MARRVSLNSLLDDAKTTLDSPSETTDSGPSQVAAQSPEPNPQTRPAPEAAKPASSRSTDKSAGRPSPQRALTKSKPDVAPERVHFSTLVRKEARLRDDQIESLTLRARKLSRNKATSEQRITDNTLIRVAVDLLLSREGDLVGTSEAELRKSVGL